MIGEEEVQLTKHLKSEHYYIFSQQYEITEFLVLTVLKRPVQQVTLVDYSTQKRPFGAFSTLLPL